VSLRIEVDEPALADDLATCLVEAGYYAHVIDGGVVDARLPFAAESAASIDLRMILRAWSARTGGSVTTVMGALPSR
jgi:hypothetical protein